MRGCRDNAVTSICIETIIVSTVENTPNDGYDMRDAPYK